MRRLLLLLAAAALGGLVVYRARMLDQRERRLGIGRYDDAAGPQSASEPSSRSNHTFTSIPPP
jgi:hypothetical protein